jgi:ribose/xylose/arabinose/galactoside ABC-type transport system permease subunit
MTTAFWIKRALLVLVLSFAIIAGAQYLKTKDLNYAMTQAAIWGAVSTATYMVVLWRKLKKHPACAVRADDKKT